MRLLNKTAVLHGSSRRLAYVAGFGRRLGTA